MRLLHQNTAGGRIHCGSPGRRSGCEIDHQILRENSCTVDRQSHRVDRCPGAALEQGRDLAVPRIGINSDGFQDGCSAATPGCDRVQIAEPIDGERDR